MDIKIIKNSSYLLFAQGIVKVLAFFYTIFLANTLGVEKFGLLVVALSYFSLFSSIADFGFSRYLIREVAKNKIVLKQLFVTILTLKFSLLCSLYGVFAFLLYILDPDSTRVAITLLAVLAVLPQSVALTFDAIFVANEKLSYSSFGLIILGIANTLFGVWLVGTSHDSFEAVFALIISQIIYMVFMVVFTFYKKYPFFGGFDTNYLKKIIVGSLPYGFLGVLGLLYFKIDSILLSYLKGSYDTGIYGAAYRFLEAVIFVPSALASALFPILAKLHQEDLAQVKKIYYKSLLFLAVLSLPVVLGYILLLPILINNFLPQYTNSIQAIFILTLAIPFIFIHVPGAIVLLSTDKYLKTIIKLSFLTLGFNIVANLLLIQKFGYIGSSWATVLSEAFTFVIFFSLIKNKIILKSVKIP